MIAPISCSPNFQTHIIQFLSLSHISCSYHYNLEREKEREEMVQITGVHEEATKLGTF